MTNNFLQKSAYLLTFAVCIALLTGLFKSSKPEQKISGSLVFSGTYQHGQNVDKIYVQNGNFGTTIYLENGHWKIKESNGYYAGLMLTADLFKNFNLSKLKRVYNGKAVFDKKIITYVGTEKVDEVELSQETESGLFAVKNQAVKTPWLTETKFILPTEQYAWLQQPLANLSAKEIRKINLIEGGTEDVFFRNDNEEYFMHNSERVGLLSNFTDEFLYLSFEDVLPAEKFNFEQYAKLREIELETFSGLIMHFNIYSDNAQNYWTSLKLLSAPLITFDKKDYIKSNEFLYNGWYFKLPAEVGKKLVAFKG